MNYKQEEINELTKKRKRIEKRIKKLTRRETVMGELLRDVKGGYHSPNAPFLIVAGGLLGLAVGLSILCFATMSTLTMALGVGIPFGMLGVSVGTHFILKNKYTKNEKELKELKEQRKEIVKHLDCVRTNQQYVAPEPKPVEQDPTEFFFSKLAMASAKLEERRKQNLLQKARERGIEVDRILQGPTAYDTKKEYKEAKKDFDNFIEENKNFNV